MSMIFYSEMSADMIQEELNRAAVRSEENYTEKKSRLYLKLISNPVQGSTNEKTVMAVRTKYFGREVTARKLVISVNQHDSGSKITVDFPAGLSIKLFPLSILAVIIFCVVLLLIVVPLQGFLSEKVPDSQWISDIIEVVTIGLATAIGTGLPGYFISDHIHAGNFAISLIKSTGAITEKEFNENNQRFGISTFKSTGGSVLNHSKACQKCGKTNHPDARFCSGCGAELNQQ